MPSISHLLRQLAVVSRASRSIVNGQVVETMAVVGTVACRLTSPRGANLATYAASEQPTRLRLLYLEPGADVRVNDDVTVNSATYRTIDVEDQPDQAYRMATLRALA
jgi:hypothetical protein